MRCSVTVSDYVNEYYTNLAKELGVSKDKAMGMVLVKHMDKNPRNAGRKMDDSIDRDGIVLSRKQGLSIRAIARKYNCSAGTVHKLINERLSEVEEGDF